MAIFTNDDSIEQVIKEILVYSWPKRGLHTHSGGSWRAYEYDSIRVLLAKLERLDWEIAQRIKNGQRYTGMISMASNGSTGPNQSSLKRGAVSTYPSLIHPVTIRPGITPFYAQYTLICSDSEAIQVKPKNANIPTAIHFPFPLNKPTAYEYPDSTLIANRLVKQVMSQPMGPDLDFAHQQELVGTVTKACLPND